MPGLLALIAVAAILVVLVLAIVIAHDATHPVRRTGAYAAARGLPFDPGDIGYTFHEWTLESRGAKLPIWDVPLGSRASATAIFIHGWGESRIDMLRHLQSVQNAAGRAVLFDLRGHGEATSSSRLGHGEDDDLLALLERLGATDRFIFIARDLGANIAIAAAMKESPVRDRISGLLAVAPYDDYHKLLKRRLARHEFPTWPMTDLAMMWFSLSGRRPLTVGAEQLSRLEVPHLILDEPDEASIADFVRRIATGRETSVTPSPSPSSPRASSAETSDTPAGETQ